MRIDRVERLLHKKVTKPVEWAEPEAVCSADLFILDGTYHLTHHTDCPLHGPVQDYVEAV